MGDIVTVPVTSGTAQARVVMRGDPYAHLSIDERFLTWVATEKLLKSDSIVVAWLGPNPLSHNNANYVPIYNYKSMPVHEHVIPDPELREP